LVNRFEKPAIVLSVKDGVAKGSARSVGDVNIYELIKEHEHLLTKFGGHKMAAGLGLLEENVVAFREAINATASKLDPKDFLPKEQITGVLDSDDIDLELIELLETFEPYGEANHRPIFLIKDAQVVSVKLMGADKSHSRIEIRQYPHQRKTIEVIAFRTVFEAPEDKRITCSYTIAKNEFNGKVTPQLLVNKVY
jgi:single-stranded-DNA-specific exonuclease